MRLRAWFAIYAMSTVAAFASPFAIRSIEMMRRRTIPVNSEAALAPAPAPHRAPTGAFDPLPACEAPDGSEYYNGYHFSAGSEIEERHTFVPDIKVQFCVIGRDSTVYLVATSDNDNWFRAYTRNGQMKWSVARAEYCSPPAVARDGSAYIISMPRSGNTTLAAYDPDGRQRWTFPTGGFEWNPIPPAIGPDGTVYAYDGGQSTDEIIAITANGEKL